MQFTPPNQQAWQSIANVAPTVSLANIFNEQLANNAGWAVNNVRWANVGGRIQLTCQIGCSDRDGHLYRLSYFIAVIGKFA